MGVLVTSSLAGCAALTTSCPAAQPVASNQQMVRDSDPPCQDLMPPTLGSLWKGKGHSWQSKAGLPEDQP